MNGWLLSHMPLNTENTDQHLESAYAIVCRLLPSHSICNIALTITRDGMVGSMLEKGRSGLSQGRA